MSRGGTMGNPVVHFEVMGSDVKSLINFYADLFGWHIDFQPEMNYGVVDTHAGIGMNGGLGKSQSGKSYVTFYMAVDDLDATLKKIEKAGGKTTQPPMEIPNVVTFAPITDPEGNMLGLVSGGPPPDMTGKPTGNIEVGWFEIVAPTLEGADNLAKFYSSIFGWKTKRNDMGRGFIYHEVDPQTNNVGASGGIGNAMDGKPYVTVYAGVDDVTKTLEQAESLGASIAMPEMKVTQDTIIGQFTDPQGNLFGVYKRMPH
ncbi:MAG: VOC family protein [Actinomycetota bacterium]